MAFSSSVPTVSNEIMNMFDNDEPPTNSAYQFLETEYEDVEYIDDELEEVYNEVPACEEVVVEDICKLEEFDEFTVGHNEIVTFEEIMQKDIAKSEEIYEFPIGHDDVEDCEKATDFVEDVAKCEQVDELDIGHDEVKVFEEAIDIVDTVDESLGILEELVPSSEYPVSFPSEKGSLVRKKRKKNPELWKSNIRKKQRESGQQYISMNNKKVAARTMKQPCNNCCYKCANLFTAEERLDIFNSFWSLTDNQKSSFYFKFVIRAPVKRRRTCSEETTKQFSYKYYFEKNQSIHRVCRVFFLNTLAIDQKRIYYCFQNFKIKASSKIKDNIGKFEEIDELAVVQNEDVVSDETMTLENVMACGETVEDTIGKLKVVDILSPQKPISFSSESESLLTKKRKKNPELWKCNIRKKQRESGQQYTAINNKKIPARTLKPPCNDCCYNCAKIFTAEERLNIFELFWSLTDSEKTRFYLKFVIRDRVKRRSKYADETIKQFTYHYYFENNQSIRRVCRIFFLNTLAIDQKRIYYCFQNLKSMSDFAIEDNTVKFEEVDELAVVHDETVVFDEAMICKETIEAKIGKLEEIAVPCSQNPIGFPSESENLLTKKQKKNPKLKKSNKRKEQRVTKPKDISIKKEISARAMKPPCKNCCLNCVSKFSAEERLNIFKTFWSLTNNEKKDFYFKFVIRDRVKRRRKYTDETIKKFTFKYYFENNQSIHRVCREFFLNTLSIDQKRIYYCFQNLQNKFSFPIEDNIVKFDEVDEFGVGNDEIVPCEEARVCEKVMTCEETVEDNIDNLDEVVVPSSVYPVYISSENKSLLRKKRKRNPELWKANIRKRLRKSGQQYISITNKEVPAKAMKPPCTDCFFKCVNVFTAEERLNIFKTFWSLSDNEKKNFYLKFVIRSGVKRRRMHSLENIKKYSFKYYFEKNRSIHRVCRVFFINTLGIDQKRIYYCFQTLQNKSGSQIEGKTVKLEEVAEFGIDCEKTVEDGNNNLDEFIIPCPEYTVCSSLEKGTMLTKRQNKKPKLRKSNIRKRQQKSGKQYKSKIKKEA